MCLQKENLKMYMSLLVGYFLTSIAFVVVYLYCMKTGVKGSNFIADIQASSGVPFYTGILSNIGILLWAFTTAICFYSSLLVRDRHKTQFLVFSGMFSLCFLLDDFFLIHEQVLPVYVGFPEKTMYIVYLVFLIGYVSYFKKLLLKTNCLLFFFIWVWFGMSSFADVLPEFFNVEHYVYYVEEAFKAFGILTWFAYFSTTSFSFIKE